MFKYSYIFIVVNFFCCHSLIAQDDLSVSKIRNLNIAVIHKLNILSNYIYLELEDEEVINEKLIISNDVYPDNQDDSLISISSYFSDARIDYKSKPTFKYNILSISTPFSIDGHFKCNAIVSKITSRGSVNCHDDDPLNIAPDTISQLISITAKLDSYKTEDLETNERWLLTIDTIKTAAPKGRRVKLETKKSKRYYYQRFGINIHEMDTFISPKEFTNNDSSQLYYGVKNLNTKISIDGSSYNSFYQLLNENRTKNSCENVPVIEMNDGRLGYNAIIASYNFGYPKLSVYSSIIPVDKNQILNTKFKNLEILLNRSWYWKSSLRITTGLGYSNAQFSFESAIDSHQDVYQSVDVDGGNYIRIVNYANMSDRLKLNYHAFPIKLGLDVELLWNRIDFFKQHKLMLAGAFTCAPMFNYKGSSERSANINYSGTYSDLFNITISENGIYDFGNYQISPVKTNIDPITNMKLSFGLDFGVKAFFDVWCLSFSVNQFWLPNSIFPDQENEYLSKDFNQLNSYLANIDDSRISMLGYSIKLGYVMNRNKRINGEKEEF